MAVIDVIVAQPVLLLGSRCHAEFGQLNDIELGYDFVAMAVMSTIYTMVFLFSSSSSQMGSEGWRFCSCWG